MSPQVIGGDLAVAEGAFAASRRLFDEVGSQMQSTDTAGLTHSQLEELLGSRMREVTRALYQDHLRLRELTEKRVPEVVDAQGIGRTRIERGRSRALATVFGKVWVGRIAYRGTGHADLHPADAALNLPGGLHSHGLAKLAAIESSRGSFADALERINALTGAGIGHRQVQELAVGAAGDIVSFYDALTPAPCTDATLLVLSCDGKGIVIRPGALREATAKAAAAKGGNLMKTRLAAGEKNRRKRMATLGAVYDAEPVPRTIDQIIPGPDRDEGANSGPDPRPPRPRARAKWLTGSVSDTAADVVRAVFDQAEHRDPGHRRPWIVLVDGARHQLDLIEHEAERRGATVRIVIDLIHVLEYLWGAAWCLHNNGDPAAEDFVACHGRAILAGRAEHVANDLAKAAYLHYDTALASGWPIATGIIEGAWCHLVKDRLDITGARWGLSGAEAVLKLRALRANSDFDTYWTWHEQQEHARNHQTRYRDQLIPAA